jgi:hypothetical protein
MGGARWEAARFVNRTPRRPVPVSSALRDRIGALNREARQLRRSLADRQSRVEKLAANLEAATREP